MAVVCQVIATHRWRCYVIGWWFCGHTTCQYMAGLFDLFPYPGWRLLSRQCTFLGFNKSVCLHTWPEIEILTNYKLQTTPDTRQATLDNVLDNVVPYTDRTEQNARANKKIGRSSNRSTSSWTQTIATKTPTPPPEAHREGTRITWTGVVVGETAWIDTRR